MRYRVMPNGCWEWTGATYDDGYGQIKLLGKGMPAHRAMFMVVHGPVRYGQQVCHRCDNRRCINPEHLFLGDARINKHDAMAKGRHTYGERSNQKLNEVAVRVIRYLTNEGFTRSRLARAYGITPSMVSHIKYGRAWGWLS